MRKARETVKKDLEVAARTAGLAAPAELGVDSCGDRARGSQQRDPGREQIVAEPLGEHQRTGTPEFDVALALLFELLPDKADLTPQIGHKTTSDSKHQPAPDQRAHQVEHGTQRVWVGVELRNAREMVQNEVESKLL